MNKKFLMFGLPVLALALVSAALLQYFGMFTMTGHVSQSVSVDGVSGQVGISHVIPEAAPGGESFCYLHKLRNDASIDIEVDLLTECFDKTGKVDCDEYYGIDVGVYEVPGETTLTLCEKDLTWKCTGTKRATLTFDTVNPRFVGTLTTTDLDSVEYALIYYPDEDPRFEKWGGTSGKVIEIFDGGTTTVNIDVDLGVNLPDGNLPDWNINPSPNYCGGVNGFDNYEHCRGAKLWIVPTSDLTSGNNLPVINWGNHGNWLFETDLITYSDCNLTTNYVVDMDRGSEIASVLNTQSHSMTPMLVCYDFKVMIAPDTYTITTTVDAK